MLTRYFEDEDILVIQLSANQVVENRASDTDILVGFDEKGFPVEITLLDAYKDYRSLFDSCRNAYNLKMRRQAGARPKSITARENGKKGGRPKKIN